MRTIRLLLPLFLLLSSGSANAFPQNISQMLEKASHFKEDDSVILLEEVEMRLAADGKSYKRHRIIKLLRTEYAVRMLADPKIDYNEKKENLNIIKSRTYTADGREADTAKNGFNLITPFELEKAPFYTFFKEMVVTHVGVEKGSVTELEYETTDNEPWRTFAGAIILAGNEPRLTKNIKITVPDNVKFYFRFLDPPGLFDKAPIAQVSSREGETVYFWRIENIRALETFRDAPQGFYPAIYFSTSTIADADMKFLNSICSGTPGKYVKEKTASILEKSVSPIEKIAKILGFISERMTQSVWYPEELYGIARDADEILLTGYSTLYERGILLCSMLAAAGLKAEPVFTSELFVLPQDIFIPWLFDGIYLRISENLRTLGFLDTGTQRFYHADLFDAIVYKKWELDTREKIVKFHDRHPVVKNEAYVNLEFEINDNLAVSGKGSFSLTGAYNTYFAVSKDEKGFENLAKKIATSLFDNAVVASLIQENVSIEEIRGKFRFSADMSKPVGNRLHFFDGAKLKSALSKPFSPILVPDRKPLVKTSGIVREVFEIKVKLPKRVRASFFSDSVKLSNDAGRFSVSSALVDNSLTIRYEFESNDNYAPYYKIIELISGADFAFCLEII